jgi:hypothetical protein
LSSLYPASLARFATGCRGSAGIATLTGTNDASAWLGEPFTLAAEPVPAGAASWLLFGRTAWPADLTALGLTGCVLRVRPFLLQPGAAGARFTLNLPPDPTLTGAAFAAQALVADPGANPSGLVLSDAVLGRLGWR